MNKSNSYLTELSTLEQKNINGGSDGEGTLADEIGWLIGRVWKHITTSHRARAQGQIQAYE